MNFSFYGKFGNSDGLTIEGGKKVIPCLSGGEMSIRAVASPSLRKAVHTRAVG